MERMIMVKNECVEVEFDYISEEWIIRDSSLDDKEFYKLVRLIDNMNENKNIEKKIYNVICLVMCNNFENFLKNLKIWGEND